MITTQYEDPTNAQEQAAQHLAIRFDRVKVRRIPLGETDLIVEGIVDAEQRVEGYMTKAPRVSVMRITEEGRVTAA
jgi:hypothetical protein